MLTSLLQAALSRITLLLALTAVAVILAISVASYKKAPPPPPITILFTGDFMFDRYIRQIALSKGNDFILENVKPTLLDNDLVVINLEGPITHFASKSIYSVIGSPPNFIFTFDTSVAQTLVDHNINLVNIGNNHILNFGQAGLKETKELLQQAGVEYFGNTGGSDSENRWLTKELGGLKLGFVNYNQFVGNGLEATLEDIEQAKEITDLVILYAHWGPEYTPESVPTIQELAHTFVDKGVDLIIGSHPHVVQQKEVYQGKTIYYSLGNFVMDQYFSQETKEGLLVRVTIDATSYSMEFEEIPTTMDLSGQTKISKIKVSE